MVFCWSTKLLTRSLFQEVTTKTNFDIFLSQLKETNATLDYFVDFEKVKNNVNKVSLKLNQLNYLLGKENLKEAITPIIEKYNSANPETRAKTK